MVSAEFCGLVWHGTSIGFSGNRCRPRKRKWLKLKRASELRTGAGSLLVAPPHTSEIKMWGGAAAAHRCACFWLLAVKRWTELKKKFSQTVQFRTFVLILPSGTLMCSGEIGILVKQSIDVHVLCIIVIYNIEEIWPKFRKLLACSHFGVLRTCSLISLVY
jgi:hypothetical protein